MGVVRMLGRPHNMCCVELSSRRLCTVTYTGTYYYSTILSPFLVSDTCEPLNRLLVLGRVLDFAKYKFISLIRRALAKRLSTTPFEPRAA